MLSDLHSTCPGDIYEKKFRLPKKILFFNFFRLSWRKVAVFRLKLSRRGCQNRIQSVELNVLRYLFLRNWTLFSVTDRQFFGFCQFFGVLVETASKSIQRNNFMKMSFLRRNSALDFLQTIRAVFRPFVKRNFAWIVENEFYVSEESFWGKKHFCKQFSHFPMFSDISGLKFSLNFGHWPETFRHSVGNFQLVIMCSVYLSKRDVWLKLILRKKIHCFLFSRTSKKIVMIFRLSSSRWRFQNCVQRVQRNTLSIFSRKKCIFYKFWGWL